MTVIAALVDEKNAWMAADSFVSDGELGGESRLPKIRQFTTPFGEVIVGVAGDVVACNSIALLTSAPRKKKNETELQYFLDSLPTRWKRSLISRGIDPGKVEFEVLLARPGELWVYDSTFAGDMINQRWWAIGSGGHVGIGALHCLAGKKNVGPEEMLSMVVDITSRYVVNAGGEAVVVGV